MKAQGMKSWILALATLAAGCAAQAGQTTEDLGGSPEQLSAVPATAAAQSTPADKTRLRVFRGTDGTLYFAPHEGAQELRLNVDPGDPSADDGDGREPDPHPWHSDVSLAR